MMIPRLLRPAAILLAMALAHAAGDAAAQQQPAPPPGEAPPALMIVFDGSGSMWGKLPGERETKLTLAREGLEPTLEKAAAGTRIGLASFGHRRKADCTDAEVMLAPETGEAQRILAPLEKLNPKGKGPLVAALREAAKAISGETGRRSLLLIHDDLDNCQQDPCAAVDDLQRSAPGIVVHVVSVGLRKEDGARMSCLARRTGGRHFEPQSAEPLAESIAEAVRLASADPGPAAAPAAAAAKAAPARQPASEEGPSGLRLSAVLVGGSEALEAPVRWRVFAAGREQAAALAEATGATVELALAGGRYVVEASHGLVSGRREVEVKPKGATVHVHALDAGTLRLHSFLAKGVTASANAVVSIRTAGNAPGRTVWIGRDADGEILLPPGNYVVTTEDGLVRLERTVTLAAGNRTELDLVIGAGRLRVMALDREGGRPLAGAVLSVAEDDPDAARGRREVARSVAAEASFLLPAGTYYLTARQGAAELRDRVVIRAGEEMRRALVLNVGHLALASRVQGATAAPPEGISHRITLLEGGGREVARAAGPDAAFDLQAGRYRIESQIGTLNARTTRDIDVRAGGEQKVAVDFQAGQVRLRLAESVGASYSDVVWDIRDARGASVWRTVQPEPKAVLAAGRYTVLAETREKRIERAIEVRSGDLRVIEIGAD